MYNHITHVQLVKLFGLCIMHIYTVFKNGSLKLFIIGLRKLL